MEGSGLGPPGGGGLNENRTRSPSSISDVTQVGEYVNRKKSVAKLNASNDPDVVAKFEGKSNFAEGAVGRWDLQHHLYDGVRHAIVPVSPVLEVACVASGDVDPS